MSELVESQLWPDSDAFDEWSKRDQGKVRTMQGKVKKGMILRLHRHTMLLCCS